MSSCENSAMNSLIQLGIDTADHQLFDRVRGTTGYKCRIAVLYGHKSRGFHICHKGIRSRNSLGQMTLSLYLNEARG